MLVEDEMNNSTGAKWKINTEQKKEMMSTRLKKVLHFSINKLNLPDVELLQEAEKCIVKMVQLKYFNKELKLFKMKNEENVKISSKISSLNPYLDENGIIRVGGSLENLASTMKASIQYWFQMIVMSQNRLSYGVIMKQDILVEV